MNRQQLEHILRAASAITGATEFVIIGSQALLAPYSTPPLTLTRSLEADLFTFRSTDDAELIDGSIGEGSPFHKTFGYYAHGVGLETARLPAGWRDRLVPLRTPNTGGATGMCLEVHDLAVSKLAAGREKDLAFLAELFRCRLAEPAVVSQRLVETPLNERELELARARLERLGRAS